MGKFGIILTVVGFICSLAGGSLTAKDNEERIEKLVDEKMKERERES